MFNDILSILTPGRVLTPPLLAVLFFSLPSANVLAEEPSTFFCGAANPEEAQSIKNIIPALYSTVSGPAGSEKNWPLLSSLFARTGSVTPMFHDKDGAMTAETISVEAFIELNKKIFKDEGFYEKEVARETFVFGHMASILSHYASRNSPAAQPYAQGVNSFQLLHDGRRWCVISVTWDSNKGGHPITGELFD